MRTYLSTVYQLNHPPFGVSIILPAALLFLCIKWKLTESLHYFWKELIFALNTINNTTSLGRWPHRGAPKMCFQDGMGDSFSRYGHSMEKANKIRRKESSLQILWDFWDFHKSVSQVTRLLKKNVTKYYAKVRFKCFFPKNNLLHTNVH